MALPPTHVYAQALATEPDPLHAAISVACADPEYTTADLSLLVHLHLTEIHRLLLLVPCSYDAVRYNLRVLGLLAWPTEPKLKF